MFERARGWIDAERVEQVGRFGGHVGLQQDAADAQGFGAEVDDSIELVFDFWGRGRFGEVPGRSVLHEFVCLFGRKRGAFRGCEHVWGGESGWIRTLRITFMMAESAGLEFSSSM